MTAPVIVEPGSANIQEIQNFLEKASIESNSIKWNIVEKIVVPDEKNIISQTLASCCENGEINLILTTGGTGYSPRDVTPEATEAVITKRADALITACLIEGLKTVPTAMLSRAIAGIRNNTLIINMPGSPKAVRENLQVLMKGRLEHALKLMRNEPTHH